MKDSYNKMALPRRPSIRFSRIWPRWPFFVWLLAVLAAVGIYYHGIEFAQLQGVVQTKEEQIAPLETARMSAVFISEGDFVTNGQVVAQMNTVLIDAELQVQKAIAVEETGTPAGYTESILRLYSQFRIAATDAETSLHDARRAQAEAIAELDVLTEEIDRVQDLLERRLIGADQLVRTKARQAALQRSVAMYPELVRALEGQVADASRQARLLADLISLDNEDDPSKAMRKAQLARENLMKEQEELLLRRREMYTLRATRDGMVSRVFFQAGDVVAAGTPVLSVVEQTSDSVVGFLLEGMALNFGLHDRAFVECSSRPGQAFSAEIVALGPEIVGMPGRVAPIRGLPIRGRRIVLHIAEKEVGLLPGETVNIRIVPERSGTIRRLADRFTGLFRRNKSNKPTR